MWRTVAASEVGIASVMRPATISTRIRPFVSTIRTVRAPRGTRSVVASAGGFSSMRFGGRSATPCDAIVRAKSTGSPPAPRVGRSIAAGNALQQLGERQIRERLENEVCVLEPERRGDRVRHGDAVNLRRLRGAHPVR